MNSILVTGGAGYIGSHTVRLLAENGYHTVSYDNLSQGHREAVLGQTLVVGDLSDQACLDDVFRRYPIEGVMHFAARCSVGESVRRPDVYYRENLGNALNLLQIMLRHDVRILVLSSTCATYGIPEKNPIDETHPQNPASPYGESKLFLEKILSRYQVVFGLRSVALRYFNAAGASLDACLGESHQPETHLIPRLLKTAGEGEAVSLFGDDYPTPDGTCIRDYVHVQDLAIAHLAAYSWLRDGNPGQAFNLGSGRGYSVRQVLDAARSVTGQEIPVRVEARRPGDPPWLVANASSIERLLGWKPRHSDLETILESAWAWEKRRRF